LPDRKVNVVNVELLYDLTEYNELKEEYEELLIKK
jgi:hypothetical protein